MPGLHASEAFISLAGLRFDYACVVRNIVVGTEQDHHIFAVTGMCDKRTTTSPVCRRLLLIAIVGPFASNLISSLICARLVSLIFGIYLAKIP